MNMLNMNHGRFHHNKARMGFEWLNIFFFFFFYKVKLLHFSLGNGTSEIHNSCLKVDAPSGVSFSCS